MTLTIAAQEFALFRELLHDRCGILLPDNKKYLLETRLSGLVKDARCISFGQFYLMTKTASVHSAFFQSIIDAITTNETLWFRDRKPFEIFAGQVLPLYQDSIRAGKQQTLKIWSAACSTGQEPYSIAMSILEHDGLPGGNLAAYTQILATDISAQALALAQNGRYDSLSMGRGLPNHYIGKYFTPENNQWLINNSVRRLITFKQFNLKDPMAGLFGPFDIIFLRNVVIYFSDIFKKQLYNNLRRVMKPGGFLFLGAGESASGYSEAFEMLDRDGIIYFRLKIE